MPREKRTSAVTRVSPDPAPVEPVTWRIEATLTDEEAGFLAAALGDADVAGGVPWSIFRGIFGGGGGGAPSSYFGHRDRLAARRAQ